MGVKFYKEKQDISFMSMRTTMHIAKQKRRDQLSIIANILDITQPGLRKTQIMYRANLSFWQLNEYLTFLQKNELISQTIVEGKEVYKVTPKGLGFLKRHRELEQMLEIHKTCNEHQNPMLKTSRI
jgi:predicted transcriptional regulator